MERQIWSEKLKNNPELLTIKQVSGILNISVGTTRRMIKSKVIKAGKVGGLLRIPKECLIDFLTTVDD